MLGSVEQNAAVEFASFQDYADSLLTDLFALYEDSLDKVIVVGAIPNTRYDCLVRPVYLFASCTTDSVTSRAFEFNERARSYFAEHGIDFFEPTDYFCDDLRCRVVTDDGHPIYSDSHHLSKRGSQLVIPGLLAAINSKRRSLEARNPAGSRATPVGGL
jgi:hypothetical protein